MLPFSLTLTAFVGALLALGAQRLLRELDYASILALAAGAIAGESIVGVVIAALLTFGIL